MHNVELVLTKFDYAYSDEHAFADRYQVSGLAYNQHLAFYLGL